MEPDKETSNESLFCENQFFISLDDHVKAEFSYIYKLSKKQLANEFP